MADILANTMSTEAVSPDCQHLFNIMLTSDLLQHCPWKKGKTTGSVGKVPKMDQ